MALELISANHAAGMAATLAGRANRSGRGFCSGVYPITPSTECMEFLCGQTFEKGHVVKVESEHSAMAVCIGASLAGARTFTTSASNGVAYMVENIITAAFYRLPVVMAVANRTLGPPWNIWADHGDTMMLRDSGCIQLYCADNQEVMDTILCAYRLAEDQRIMLPVLVCQDGFILSHTMAQTDIPDQEDVDRFLPPLTVPHRLTGTPKIIGNITTPQITETHRAMHQQAMARVAGVYAGIQDEFEKVFGRRPAALAVPHRTEDAETIIVSMGTISSTVDRAVNDMREQGIRVGSVRVRALRPFPGKLLQDLFAGKKRIAIIDRNISLGLGGVLWSESRALAGPETLVQGYMAGIGGGDLRPSHVKAIHEDLLSRETSGEPVVWESNR